jgi:hypothetical protein
VRRFKQILKAKHLYACLLAFTLLTGCGTTPGGYGSDEDQSTRRILAIRNYYAKGEVRAAYFDIDSALLLESGPSKIKTLFDSEPSLAKGYDDYLRATIAASSDRATVEAATSRLKNAQRVVNPTTYASLMGLLSQKIEAQVALENAASAAADRRRRDAQEIEDRRNKEAAAIAERIRVAALNASVSCESKAQCDKAFSLTQIYISTNADMKIQVATDAIIETYNPTDDGNIGMKAIRMPNKTVGSTITLIVMCKGSAVLCDNRRVAAYEGFSPFLRGSM